VAKAYALSEPVARWAVEQAGRRQGTKAPPDLGTFRDIPDGRIIFRNDSGETVPAWGIVRVSGYADAGERHCVTVVKPATTPGWFIVNGPNSVPDGENGIAQGGQVVRVVYDAADSPTVLQHYGVDGFKARSFPSGNPVVNVLIHGVLDSTEKIALATIRPISELMVQAPSGGIPGRVGSLVQGATCDAIVMGTSNDTLTATSMQLKVYNWTTNTACANGDRYGIASLINGKWHIIAEDCNDGGSTVEPGAGTGTTVKPTDAIDTSTLTPLVTIGVGGSVSYTSGATPIP